ncbi:MAG: SMC-Scp complex subunit ScpB [Bdellovibrionia bacterium]
MKKNKKSKAKKLDALSSIVTWVGDPSHLNTSPSDSLSEDLGGEEDLEEQSHDAENSLDSSVNEPEDSEELDSEQDFSDEDLSHEETQSAPFLNPEPIASEDPETKSIDSSTLPTWDEESSELELQAPEEIEDQLKRLSKIIQTQAQEALAEQETLEASLQFNPDEELARQIAEDQALENQEQLDRAQIMGEIQTESYGEDPLSQIDQAKSPEETAVDQAELQSCIEALLFISDKPLPLAKLREFLNPSLELAWYEQALAEMQQRYSQLCHGIELLEVGGGYQLRTKLARSELAKKLVKVQAQKLSSGAMESLAIIAYKQPVMKEEIDKIRGVDSSYFIRGLIDKKLIKISGRSELPGRPVLYATTHEFLELFGLKDLSSLPSLKELEQMIPASQTKNPQDEDPKVKVMRKMVSEMNLDGSGALNYDPKEDDRLLKDFRERVSSIPSSTPYLDELKAAELLAKQQQDEARLAQAQAQARTQSQATAPISEH